MKFNVIKITPIDGEWDIDVIKDDYERVGCSNKPNPLGLFYCPKEIQIDKGIEMLKETMIKYHYKEIKRLINSLNKLKGVKYDQ